MVDSSVNTSRPSSRQNARMSPPTHPAFPTTDSGTMTSRPNSKQSSRGHSRPSSRQSSSLRPGSRQSTRSGSRGGSRPNTPSVVRFSDEVDALGIPGNNTRSGAAHSKPPPDGKNMGSEYYKKIGPSPPRASRRALKRGGHNNRPHTSDNGSLPGSAHYVEEQTFTNSGDGLQFAGGMNDQPPAFSLPAVVAKEAEQYDKEESRYVEEHFEKFEEENEMDGGKYGESYDNRLLTASPTMRLSESELARLKRVEEIRNQQNVTLVQIIEIERRLEEQRITMLANALPGDKQRLKSIFVKERRQAAQNIRLLVEKHQKELKSAMHAMGVAFLSRSIHEPGGKQAAQMGEGNGKAQKKKKKKRKKVVDKESKKLRKEIGGALKSLQQ